MVAAKGAAGAVVESISPSLLSGVAVVAGVRLSFSKILFLVEAAPWACGMVFEDMVDALVMLSYLRFVLIKYLDGRMDVGA